MRFKFYVTLICLYAAPAFAVMTSVGVVAKAKKYTSSNVATSSVQIMGDNPRRIGFMIYNNSSNSAYVTFGPTSSGSTPSFIIATFANWNWNAFYSYTGPVSAIRNAGTGTIIVTEFESK